MSCLLDNLDMLNKLWVKEGEAGELVLVEVHHEQLVRGRQGGGLLREARVKVRHVLVMSLRIKSLYTRRVSCYNPD